MLKLHFSPSGFGPVKAGSTYATSIKYKKKYVCIGETQVQVYEEGNIPFSYACIAPIHMYFFLCLCLRLHHTCGPAFTHRIDHSRSREFWLVPSPSPSPKQKHTHYTHARTHARTHTHTHTHAHTCTRTHACTTHTPQTRHTTQTSNEALTHEHAA